MQRIIIYGLGPEASILYNGIVYYDTDDLECDEALAGLLIIKGLAVSYNSEFKAKVLKLKQTAEKKRQQILAKMEKLKRGDA